MVTGTLLATVGCAVGTNYTFKGSEKETNVVVITNCVAEPDSVIVKNKKQFHWEVDKNDVATYIIAFDKDNPTDDPPVVVVSAKLKDKDHTAHGGFGCGTVFPDACGRYPYTLWRVTLDNSEICKDPGVHVVP
jgi:hypothetical protein